MAEVAEPRDHAASFAANQRLWEAWTAVHAEGEFYDLAGFRAGGIRLHDEEIATIGDVRGRTLLHLQCHFGIDTLSWARLGARVTGVDFSPAALRLAREIAADIGIEDARFIESNIYELPDHLDGEFDVVYTSRGVLGCARHPWLGQGRGALPGTGRDLLHHRGPSGLPGLRERGCGAGRVAPHVPLLGAPRATRVRREGLVRRPGCRRRGAEGARLGPQPGRDRHGAHRRRPPDRVARGASLPLWSADFLVESEPGSGRFVLPPGVGELPLAFSLRATKPATG